MKLATFLAAALFDVASRCAWSRAMAGRKSICFVTGVPGAGKTLAGLNIATKLAKEHSDEHAVFLSGNGPLVTVLREAALFECSMSDKMRSVVAPRFRAPASDRAISLTS